MRKDEDRDFAVALYMAREVSDSFSHGYALGFLNGVCLEAWKDEYVRNIANARRWKGISA